MEQKHVLIVERGGGKLVQESIQEPVTLGRHRPKLSGNFTQFDVENRNKRYYTAENFVPVMNRLLEKKKTLGVLYGEFDHPDVFDIAGKNVSHTIDTLIYNEANNCIDGTIKLLNTRLGQDAQAIIEDGEPIFVSSRAAGVTNANGVVALKELFTYDIVLDPGFATSVMSLNESYGHSIGDEVAYRIYEMQDSGVNNLFTDNKNDQRTHMDINEMRLILSDEVAKLEAKIFASIQEGTSSPEEVTALVNEHAMVKEELEQVKKYLGEFQKKITHLMQENKKLSENNQKLTSELNETNAYSNHIASGLNNIKEDLSKIETRVSDTEGFVEHVAENTQANILFTESVARETEIAQKFAEYVANETKLTQGFTEHIANEAKLTREFAEYVANEGKDTREFAEYVANEAQTIQGFVEYVANESNKDEIYLGYIAEQVDGIVGYNTELVTRLKATTPVLESVSSEESIHGIADINEFLGNDEEFSNIIEEEPNAEDLTSGEEEEGAEEEENADDTAGVQVAGVEEQPANDGSELDANMGADLGADAATGIEGDNTEMGVEAGIEGGEAPVIVPVMDPAMGDMPGAELPADNLEDGSFEATLLNNLVKILTTDETGIVMEITPDNKLIIQKSGSEETMTVGEGEYELLNSSEDTNLTETVTSMLDEIKKSRALANQRPHFMSFLDESQITNFKMMEPEVQNDIILAMENAEYFSAADVLALIGEQINKTTVSYEDNLIENIPAPLKEAWNSLPQENKLSLIAESKYFHLTSKTDIKSFWNTRSFAKVVTGTDAVLIKESAANTTDDFTTDYVDAFMSKIDQYNK
jgi:Prohead core protein serine protease